MAGNSTVIRSSPGLSGVTPAFVYLNTTDSYDALITPGYLNNVKSAGIEIEKTDFVYAVYNNGESKGIFTLVDVDGVFTLQLYNPGSGQFQFTQLQFVAKGGSDLNPGNEISFPKLTVNAAIAALNLSPTQTGLVWILDDGEYQENVVLPFNMQLYGPSAVITAPTGDALTINDTGANTLSVVTLSALNATSPAKALNLLGAQSNIFLKCNLVQGDMHIEGGCVNANIAQIASNVHVTSTGQFGASIINAIVFALTSDPGATIIGNIQQILGPGDTINTIYGAQNIAGKLSYQTLPSTETAGRTVGIADNNTAIVYNNAANDQYLLPDTASVAIPIGTKIDFIQLGLGAVEFTAGVGVTIVSSLGATVFTSGAGAVATAYKYTDTIWVISGDISSVGP